MTASVSSYCWCGSAEVHIPVEWLRAGKTGTCERADCAPGCELHEPTDEDTDYYDPPPIRAGAKKFNMARFDPRRYDVRMDSSAGFEDLSVMILVTEPGLCPCGCGEPPKNPKATFLMGHDVRLRGKLIRAAACDLKIQRVTVEGVTVDVVDPIELALSFSTPKLDWQAATVEAVARIKKKRGIDVDQQAPDSGRAADAA
jgi:hypothetical protein